MSSVLVLVGSLRADSLNLQLAQAAIAAFPAETEVTFYDRLADIPHYDQDRDTSTPPAEVEHLRAAIAAADGILVVTPEFNGVMPGTLKDAIDWGSRPRAGAALAGKPVGILGASMSPHAALWARESVARAMTAAGASPLEGHIGIGSAHQHIQDSRITNATAQAEVERVVKELVAAL